MRQLCGLVCYGPGGLRVVQESTVYTSTSGYDQLARVLLPGMIVKLLVECQGLEYAM